MAFGMSITLGIRTMVKALPIRVDPLPMETLGSLFIRSSVEHQTTHRVLPALLYTI